MGNFPMANCCPPCAPSPPRRGANPLTVAKAYQSFQDDGLVVVKRGVGMFVAEGATRKLREAERERFLETVWPPVAAQMRRLGLRISDMDLAKA
jgi:GntR family transcriptional regulator